MESPERVLESEKRIPFENALPLGPRILPVVQGRYSQYTPSKIAGGRSGTIMALEDKLDIKLNQNIWGLVVSLAALDAAEHWCLPRLRWFSCGIWAPTPPLR